LLHFPGSKIFATEPLYVLCLMLSAFADEIIQMLFNAHPGLHKDARNLLLDLCGILLASLLVRVWQGWRFFGKNISGAPL